MNKGFGLVEAMIGIGLLIMGMTAGTLIVQKVFVGEQNLTRMSQIDVLRRIVRTQFSCRQSLGVDTSTPLPVKAVLSADKKNKSLPILGRDGVELFSMHVSEEFYRVDAWHIRARLVSDRIVFEGRLGALASTVSKEDKEFGQWRDIFEGTSMFCKEYVSETLAKCNIGPYTEIYGWDNRGAQCCRMVEVSKVGEAKAECAQHEILVRGGGYCADKYNGALLSGKDTARKVVKSTQMGPAIGATRSTVTTIAVPGVPHFFFPSAAILANILAPFENKNVTRGGFLTKNMPALRTDGTLSRWESACKYDDWQGDFATTAYAVCCPKRW